MTTRTPNLRGLIALAKRDGVDIRPTLVRVITDLFVQEPVHSPAEVERYVELARHMLDGVDVSSRFAVAMKLARYPHAPREILMMLAADTLEVAEPVLSRASFAEADLLRLADALDEPHRRILAGRKDLPASVAARLSGASAAATAAPRETSLRRPATAPTVAKDTIAKDIVVKAIVAKDIVSKDASLKAGTSGDAEPAAPASSEWERPLGLKPVAEPKPLPSWMTKPVATPAPSPAASPTAATPPAAAKPATEPKPLPSWMTKPVTAPVPAPAASPTAATPPAAAKPVTEPKPLPSWMTKPVTAPAPSPAASPTAATPPAAAKPATEPKPLPSWITKPVVAAPAATLAPAAPPAPAAVTSTRPLANLAGSTLAIADLEQAALQRKPEEFIDRLARVFDLDRARAEEVVHDATGQSVAIACRALDMPCDVFSRIVLFLDPTVGRSVALVFSLAEYYGRLSVAEANEVVASWRGTKRTAPRHQPFTAPDGVGRHSFEPRRSAPPLPGASRIAARG